MSEAMRQASSDVLDFLAKLQCESIEPADASAELRRLQVRHLMDPLILAA